MSNEKISRFIDENYNDMMRLFKTLCKIPAPSLLERRRAEFCKNQLEIFGAKNVYIDDALNVVFPVNCDGKDKITVFAAHTDTVFPDIEPLPYSEDAEKVYCAGCGDDTASVAVLLFMAKYVIENNILPENGLLIVCNAAEEGLGNLKGVRKLFDDYCGRIAQFVTLDSNIYKIIDQCVGSCRYEITAETVGGHSYFDYGNANAINVISRLVTQIYDIDIPQKSGSKTTVNVGQISGGTSVNTIAQSAKMLCEYRSNDVEHLEILKDKFYKIFDSATAAGINVKVKTIGERPCAKDVDAKKMARLREQVKAIIKSTAQAEPKFEPGSTDCNIPMSLGVPAICIGVYNGGGQHTREEYVYKNSLRKGLEIGIKSVLSLGV